MSETPRYLPTPSGDALAYHYSAGAEPTVVFCHGYGSSMRGEKALAMEQACRQWGVGFVRFDLSGCGESDGNFANATMTRWRDDALQIIDHVTTGPVVLVGSSMGAWLMVLIAKARHQRVVECFGIAAAPDMTDYKLAHGLSVAQQQVLQSEGVIGLHKGDDEPPMPLYNTLLQSGSQQRVLEGAITLPIPLTLVHARDDQDVPWQRSQALQNLWHGAPCELQLLTQGGHRLSDEQSIGILLETLQRIVRRHLPNLRERKILST